MPNKMGWFTWFAQRLPPDVIQRAQHTELLGSEDDEQSEDIPEQPVEVEQPDSAPEQGQAVHEGAGCSQTGKQVQKRVGVP